MANCDLNIPLDEDADPIVHRERVCTLITLGYSACAAAFNVAGALEDSHRCSLQHVDQPSLEAASPNVRSALRLRTRSMHRPMDTIQPSQCTQSSSADSGIVQLTRITHAPRDQGEAQSLASKDGVARSYDIVAINPKNERLMQQACMSLDVDIISLDLATRLPFKLRGPAVQAAVNRGVHFEIAYAPALREATGRRNLFVNTQALVRMTRGKGILLSSGARSASELRTPCEVQALGTLMGLSAAQARDALSLAPRAVMAHARQRRTMVQGVGVELLLPAVMEQAAPSAAAAGSAGTQDGGDELMDVDAPQAAATGTAAVPSGSQGQGQTTLPPRTGGAVSRGGGGKRKAPG